MAGRTSIDVRPPDGYFEMTKDQQQVEWVTAFIAEAFATMDAMPDEPDEPDDD